MALLFCGCGSDADNGPTGQQADAPPTGVLALRFVLAQGTIPAGSTSVVVRGSNSQGETVFGPQSFPVAASISVTVPTSVVRIQGEVLNGANEVGSFSQAVEVQIDRVVEVAIDVLAPGNGGGGDTGNVALSQIVGTYFSAAGTLDLVPDSGVERRTNLVGDLQFDGAGNIAAGSLNAVDQDGSTPGTHTGGTYVLSTADELTGTLSTQLLGPINIPDSGFVLADGDRVVDFVSGLFSADNGETGGLTYMTRRGSGLDLSSLNGLYSLNGYNTSLPETTHAYFLQIPFDGSGGLRGSAIYFSVALDAFLSGSVGNQLGNNNGLFLSTGSPSYTVDDDGDFSVTLTFAYNDAMFAARTFDMTIEGVVGANGDLVFSNVINSVQSGVGQGYFLEPLPVARVLERGGVQVSAVRGQATSTPIAEGRRCLTETVFIQSGLETGMPTIEIVAATGEVTVVTGGGFLGGVVNVNDEEELAVSAGALNRIGDSASLEGNYNGVQIRPGEGTVKEDGSISLVVVETRSSPPAVVTTYVNLSAPKPE